MRKPRNLFVCESEECEDGERGEREGEVTEALSLSSGTQRIHNERKTKPTYEFRYDERLKKEPV